MYRAMHPLALLNTTVATNDGDYSIQTISLAEVRERFATAASTGSIESAIGHQSTADVLSHLLGRKVPMNRQSFIQKIGQTALTFKLNRRPPEGQILSVEEIEKIGYTFKLMTRTA